MLDMNGMSEDLDYYTCRCFASQINQKVCVKK